MHPFKYNAVLLSTSLRLATRPYDGCRRRSLAVACQSSTQASLLRLCWQRTGRVPTRSRRVGLICIPTCATVQDRKRQHRPKPLKQTNHAPVEVAGHCCIQQMRRMTVGGLLRVGLAGSLNSERTCRANSNRVRHGRSSRKASHWNTWLCLLQSPVVVGWCVSSFWPTRPGEMLWQLECTSVCKCASAACHRH